MGTSEDLRRSLNTPCQRGDRARQSSSLAALDLRLPDPAATAALGKALASLLTTGIVYLRGDLGVGKTSLVRSLLRGRGVTGTVRSPTYTLIETYDTVTGSVYHFDLYRLADPEEMHFIGIEDITATSALTLIEWPERGEDFLPGADLIIRLEHVAPGYAPHGAIHGDNYTALLEGGGRLISLEASTQPFVEVIERLLEQPELVGSVTRP